MSKARYQYYLQTDCWKKQVRPAALARANYRCELRLVCEGDPAEEVHHACGYANLGTKWELDGLLAACKRCHRYWHGIPDVVPIPKIAANDNAPLLPFLFEKNKEVS
jgi:hypothetical protein